MVTKRESPTAKNVTVTVKTVKRRAKKTAASERTDGTAMAASEAEAATAATSGIDPEVRRQLVAAEAYFRAERRGFAAGQEVEDWIAAESVVDSRFNQRQVA
jgi:K+-transporting ATPase c subunit